MKKLLLLILFFLTINSFSQDGSPTCDGAEPACSDNTGVKIFPNVTSPDGIEATPVRGCLNDTPNAAWFYLKVDQTGDLDFKIIQNTMFDSSGNPVGDGIDVDFIAWGPFDTPDSNCANLSPDCGTEDCIDNVGNDFYYDNIDGTNIIDCSWSGEVEEEFRIRNAEAGKFYVLLVTNWAPIGETGTPGFIKLEQTNFGETDAGVTDCSIILGNLGANQEVCFGTNIQLDGTPTTITTPIDTYEWQVDTGTGFNSIPGATNAILDITNNLSGNYRVLITDTNGNSGGENEQVLITFFDIPIANDPIDVEICDTDRDGFHEFNFDVDITPQVLNGQSATDFEVLYFDSATAAMDNVASTNITSPYTNAAAFTSETIFARIQHVNRNECNNIIDFTINVRDVAAPNQPTVYRLCDDTASGSDTDTITNNFLLNTKDSEILGMANSALQFNVSYHTSLVGAQTDNSTDAIDKNSYYAVTNSQTIFVRVENVDNTNCFVTSNDTAGSTFTSFELIVDPLPVVNNPAELIQCHNNPDLNTTVNLTLARINVSSNFMNETFEYYATEAAAIAGTPQLTTTETEMYPVIETGEAWVRVISNQDCYRISKIDITVNFSADLAYDKLYVECDDFLDIDGNDNAANNDTDGVSTFDFSDATNEIKAFFPEATRPDLDVFYYESEADRAASINDINSEIANHRNNNDASFANSQTIFVKIINKTNNGCTGTAELFLQTDAVPLANNLAAPLSFCDDFVSGASDDGENTNINLRSTIDEILGTTQTEADYIVTFHTSAADANSGANPILNDTNFRNTAPVGFVKGTVSRQTIYVRVEDRTKIPACFNDHVSFDIEIRPTPALDNTISPIDVCDVPTISDTDPRNRIAQNIDITIRNSDILNGRDNTIFTVRYYKSMADALADTNRIPDANLSNYENDPTTTTFPANVNSDEPGIETIFFVINNTQTTCSSEPFTMDLRIFPEPNIPVNINNYVDCDSNNGGLGDDTDGILENIAFSTKIPEVLANYTTAEQSNFTVTFHRDLADAQSGNNALDTNAYTNETNNQSIFVRVLNNQTMCVYDDLTFDIIVNPLPSYDPLDLSQVACLNNLPLTLMVENPLTIYAYSWVENQTGNEISTAQAVDIRAGGTYTLTVTNTTTMCAKVEEFEIIESEAATITDSAIFVVDDTSDITGNSFSITIDNTNLGIGDYEYALLNEEGMQIRSYQDALIFDGLTGGFYILLVRDKNGCDINDIPASIEVPIVEFPKFFTPNGDGYNDTWTIKGANTNYYPSSEIYIYNRFGKIVAEVDLNEQGWNGTYNGKKLPSGDYWYSIQLIRFDNPDKIITKTGNFSLLRK